MRIKRISLILVMCSLAAGVIAEEASPPKIGLALSGGGARGLAHIGVLKELEKRQIRIDYIAGTSMGAIVGGLYAAGNNPAEIEEIIRSMELSELLLDDSPRKRVSMRQKNLDQDFLVKGRIGINQDGAQFPLGVLQGQRVQNRFSRETLPVMLITSFDALPIPFKAIATDLETSRAVVIDEGNLAEAMRASMAIPGVFAPAELGEYLLVDGGLANNLPVDVVRDMGADHVIAVDVSLPLYKREELTSVFLVTEQITSMMTRNNTEQQIAALARDDVLIIPELNDIGSASFDRLDEAITAGKIAASSAFANWHIQSFSAAGPAQDVPAANPAPVIEFVSLENNSHLTNEILLSRLDIQTGELLDLPELERAIDILYGLQRFEQVSWSLVKNEAGQHGINIVATEHRWGPNYLQFGMQLSDDFSGDNQFNLGAAYTLTGFNRYGGELRTEGAVGSNAKFVVDFYQPLDKQAEYFLNPTVFYRARELGLFDGDERRVRIRVAGNGGSLGIGREFGTSGLLRADYLRVEGTADVLTGEPGLNSVDFSIGEMLLTGTYDSLDNVDFPTFGTLFTATARVSRTGLGALINYEQFGANLVNAQTRGRHTFLSQLQLGYTRDDVAPSERLFQLGGFLRLSGLVPNQLSGQHYGFASLSYYRRMGNIEFLPVYAGASFETGNVWQRKDDISLESSIFAGSLFVGARTPLGPIYLGVGRTDEGDNSVYLYLGNPFTRGIFDF